MVNPYRSPILRGYLWVIIPKNRIREHQLNTVRVFPYVFRKPPVLVPWNYIQPLVSLREGRLFNHRFPLLPSRPPVNQGGNGISPFSIGNTSTPSGSIFQPAVLDYRSVTIGLPSPQKSPKTTRTPLATPWLRVWSHSQRYWCQHPQGEAETLGGRSGDQPTPPPNGPWPPAEISRLLRSLLTFGKPLSKAGY